MSSQQLKKILKFLLVATNIVQLVYAATVPFNNHNAASSGTNPNRDSLDDSHSSNIDDQTSKRNSGHVGKGDNQGMAFVPKKNKENETQQYSKDLSRKIRQQTVNEEVESLQNRRRTLMDYESIALALRLTCETNRKLLRSSTSNRSPRRNLQQQRVQSLLGTTTHANIASHPNHHYNGEHTQSLQDWQGGFSHSLINQQKQMFEDKREEIMKTTATDMFNLDSPSNRKQDLMKKLPSYVKAISSILGFETNPIVPAIAMIYLDRACSMETTSYHDQSQPSINDYGGLNSNPIQCPYLTTKSVHKLYLTAVILACRTVRNEYPISGGNGYHDQYSRQYASLLRKHKDELGGISITDEELGNWLGYMVSALGSGNDLMISSDQVDWFLHQWKNLFEWEDYLDAGDSQDRLNSPFNQKIKNSNHEQNGISSLISSSSPTKSSSWENVYDNDEDSSVVEDQGAYQAQDAYRVEEIDYSQQYHSDGDINYHYQYQREEINFSQGNPSLDNGDIWWSA